MEYGKIERSGQPAHQSNKSAHLKTLVFAAMSARELSVTEVSGPRASSDSEEAISIQLPGEPDTTEDIN